MEESLKVLNISEHITEHSKDNDTKQTNSDLTETILENENVNHVVNINRESEENNIQSNEMITVNNIQSNETMTENNILSNETMTGHTSESNETISENNIQSNETMTKNNMVNGLKDESYDNRKYIDPKLPLKEAAKLLMLNLKLNSNNSVTPVFFLQSLLARRGIAPKFELIQLEGEVSEPTFKYRVSLVSVPTLYIAIGSGKSKKEAKQNAAKNLVDSLVGQVLTNKDQYFGGTKNSIKSSTESSNVLKHEPNPISVLQEQCLLRRWSPPIYETEHDEFTLPHLKMFTVNVYVSNYRESGKGKSKKEAKREAAKYMVTFLKTIPIPSKNKKNNNVDEDLNDDEDEDDDDETKQSNHLSSKQLKMISKYHERSTTKPKGPVLTKLINIQIEEISDPIEFLEHLCLELGYKFEFINLDEKTITNNMYQCLLQINTNPISVFFGNGCTIEAAETFAAIRSLHRLKFFNK